MLKKLIAAIILTLFLLGAANLAQAGGIVIPTDTDEIGAYAFYGSAALSGELVIPNGVKSIGEYAFGGCTGLTGEIYIPESVMYIGPHAFDGCTGLTGTVYAAKGRVVDPAAFEGTSITYVDEIQARLLWQVNEDGASVTITGMTEGASNGLTIPAEVYGYPVTAIADNAFQGRDDLTGALTLPEGLTDIGACAFQNCSGLTGGLTLPSTLSEIGAGAFSGCSGLTGSIVVPSSVVSIGHEAFADCTGFTGVPEVGNQYCVMGKRVYAGCTGLTQESYFTFKSNGDGTCAVTDYTTRIDYTLVEIPAYSPDGDRVTSIGRMAFRYTRRTPVTNGFAYDVVYTVSVPEGVTYIGEYAFSESFLDYVSLPSTLQEIDSFAFYKVDYLSSIELPEGLSKVGHSVFSKCDSLCRVKIPASLGYIPYMCFNCTSLSNIVIPEGITGISSFSLNIHGYVSWTLPRSIQSIADDATAYDVTAIYGYSGTAAETFADENGIPFYDLDAAERRCGANVTVLDPSGSPVPDAAVRLVNLDGSLLASATTNSDGVCAFTNLTKDSLFYIRIDKEPYCFSSELYLTAEGVTEHYTLQALYTAKGYMDIQSPADGAELTGTDVTVSFAPVIDADEYRIDLYDLTVSSDTPASTVTVTAMEHTFEGLTAGRSYRVSVTALCSSGSELTDTADFYLLSGNEPKFVSFDVPGGSYRTGDEVTFTIHVENADSVSLVVDGVEYDTVTVTDGTAVLTRAFTQAGSREVSFRARRDGQRTAESAAFALSIIAAETLQEPAVSPIEDFRLGLPLTVSWQQSPNAEVYVIYLFRDGAQVYRKTVEADGSEEQSWQIPAPTFTSAGAYGVEVIATAPGYSQCSGGTTFNVYSFTAYTAYLQAASSSLYEDSALTIPAGSCSCTTTLTVTDQADGSLLVTAADTGATGWISAELIGTTPWSPKPELRCWYRRYNPEDPQSKVLITVWATHDVAQVVVTLPDGSTASSSEPLEITSTPHMRKFLIDVAPVTEQTAFPIAGCDAQGKSLVSTTLNVPPVKLVDQTLPAPQVAAAYTFGKGKGGTVHWVGSTGATSYVITLTKDGVNVREPITLTEALGQTSFPGTLLSKAGEYVFTITAHREGWTSASATSTITVIDGDFRYLQSTSTYLGVSFRYLLKLSSDRDWLNRHTVTWTDALGKTHSAPVEDYLLGTTPYMPETAPALGHSPVSLSGVSLLEGTTLDITLTTDMVAETVEILVNGKKQADMTLKSEFSGSRHFTAPWTLIRGEQELLFKVTGINGLVTEYPYTLKSVHTHTLDMGKTVISAMSNTGVTISSGKCTSCGETLDGTTQYLSSVFGTKIGGSSIDMWISTDLSIPDISLSIPGTLRVSKDASLECASISCGKLEVIGSVHAGSISCSTMDVSYGGSITMRADDTVSVQNLIFRSSVDHTSLLTGGTLTISGDMTGSGSFKASAGHQTVFPSGVHKLETGYNTHFGTLVIHGTATNLRASRRFTYDYIVIPRAEDNPMAEAKPQEPSAALKKYEIDYTYSSGRYISPTSAESSVRSAIRKETYASLTGANFLTATNMNRNSLGVFQIAYTADGGAYSELKRDLAVQYAGLNALNDGHAAGMSFYSVIGTYTIDLWETSTYMCTIDGESTKVTFNISVEGVSTQIGNKSVGMLNVVYNERIDGGKTKTSRLLLTPTFDSIDEILDALDWEGKKLAQQQIDEATETVMDEYNDMFIDLLNCENINKAKMYYDQLTFAAEHSVSSEDKVRAPALTVYAEDASFSIYDSYEAPDALMSTFTAMYDVK